MGKIRSGVFETNSSSSHSITVSEIGELSDTLPMLDNKYYVFAGRFYEDYGEFSDARTKASYCYTYIKEVDNPGNKEKMLKEAIEEYLKGDVVFSIAYEWDDYDNKFKTSFYGFCERSFRTAEKLFKDKETLKNFIFNPNSILIIQEDDEYIDKDNSFRRVK